MALTENNKKYLVIVMAIAIGGLATWMVSLWATNKINENTTQLKEEYDAKQKEVTADLTARAEAQANDLRQEIEKVRQEQQQAMQQQMAALQAAQQAAQQAKAQTQEQKKKPKPSLALRTPAGKRAVTVMIDSLSAVGGLINAGDSVDVIAHLNVPQEGDKDNKKTVTAMIFQNLQVLAVNTNLDEPGMYDDQQAVPTLKVTFAVDPEESGLLSFADKNGKLELALRNSDEHDKQMVKASTWKTLASYVLDNQGSNISVPDEEEKDKDQSTDSKPNVQIFRGGKEL